MLFLSKTSSQKLTFDLYVLNEQIYMRTYNIFILIPKCCFIKAQMLSFFPSKSTAEHLNKRWTQKLKRDERWYDGDFLSMGALERTPGPQHNDICFKSEWETKRMKESHWTRSFSGSFSCTGNAAKTNFNNKMIRKGMLVSQSHSLLPLFALKHLKQNEQDTQTLPS